MKELGMRAVVMVVAIMMGASFARAQYEPTFPGCEKCGVTGYVDMPATTTTVSNTDLLTRNAAVQGWGFECVSGQPVNRVDIFVEDDARSGLWHPVPPQDPNVEDLTEAGANPRPDVERAYVGLCPAIDGRWTGFTRWIDRPLPLGAHRFLFVLWRGPYHANLVKTLNVVP